jgi:hypothetical protein
MENKIGKYGYWSRFFLFDPDSRRTPAEHRQVEQQ